jgi:RNA polymerase sigma-70 factor (ECF subfamily)
MTTTPRPDDSSQLRISLVQFLSSQQAMLRGYAFALCGNYHVADDAVQELSLIVAADPHRALAGGDDAARWLRAVLRNKTFELARRAGRQQRALSDDVLKALAQSIDELDDESVARHNRMRMAMAECVSGLAGDARRVIEARYCQDLSCEAIASHVKRSVQAVYAMLKRVRLSLADCVSERLNSHLDGHLNSNEVRS